MDSGFRLSLLSSYLIFLSFPTTHAILESMYDYIQGVVTRRRSSTGPDTARAVDNLWDLRGDRGPGTCCAGR
ncbi:hypothetical protein BP00DRAFT_421852 [Aspergillus indologenus CBS 114.80]|uniref:Uncharacterized protein n=1 Tax=Aspergillus indologenus CBS 114.80 TaxID=1450541 RepID=A0A2V5IJ00_9EURO|nr:hypothetical protein BP00DRAFT_421852 [Aspergillus indologenus CBS 114.80]